jgi:hypothetical protein
MRIALGIPLGMVCALGIVGGIAAESPRSARDGSTVTLAAAGDFGSTGNTDAVTQAVAGVRPAAFIALGDYSYRRGETPAEWCERRRALNRSVPWAMIVGSKPPELAFPSAFYSCFPVPPWPVQGRWPDRYVLDIPRLARLIGIAPGTEVNGQRQDYGRKSENRRWLVDRIREARTANIPWVIVFKHKTSVTSTMKSTDGLDDLLAAQGADLALQADVHAYERSKQLRTGEGCARIQGRRPLNAACVTGDGLDGEYAKGQGAVFVTVGTAGASPDVIRTTEWMATTSGGAKPYGFLKLVVSAPMLEVQFERVGGGAYEDRFVIRAEEPS